MELEEAIKSACMAAAEMAVNVDSDLVGDHRDNYRPRIRSLVSSLAKLFPMQMADALLKAQPFS